MLCFGVIHILRHALGGGGWSCSAATKCDICGGVRPSMSDYDIKKSVNCNIFILAFNLFDTHCLCY